MCILNFPFHCICHPPKPSRLLHPRAVRVCSGRCLEGAEVTECKLFQRIWNVQIRSSFIERGLLQVLQAPLFQYTHAHPRRIAMSICGEESIPNCCATAPGWARIQPQGSVTILRQKVIHKAPGNTLHLLQLPPL